MILSGKEIFKKIKSFMFQFFFYWKDIPGYEGIYKINNFGQIKNKNGKTRKPYLINKGYYVIDLYKNGKREKWLVHRLVLLTFVGKSKLLTNHKDRNRTNNDLSNLEYCTYSENNQHAWDNGSYDKNKKNTIAGILKYNDQKKRRINQYDLKGNFIESYESILKAMKDLKLNNISACLRNKQKTAGGFIWKYSERKKG